MWAIEFIIRKLAVFITFGNSSGGEQCFRAVLQPAIAADHAAVLARKLPSGSTTDGANFSGNFHHRLSPMCANVQVLRKRWKETLCVHPVELSDSLWTIEENARPRASFANFGESL